MNYTLHYERLIERAQERSILPDEYFEEHHIVPKCLGGDNSDENLVKLFPEEHYVAHQLLVKIYPKEKSLVYAAHMMGNTRKGNKSYAWLRLKFAKIRSKTKHSEETKRKISETQRGRIGPPMPESTRSAIILANTGRSPSNKGVPMSKETKRKITATMEPIYESKRGIPMQIIECPHCNKSGNKIVMHRWHFDKCKSIIHNY
jgi:hypothetical protein